MANSFEVYCPDCKHVCGEVEEVEDAARPGFFRNVPKNAVPIQCPCGTNLQRKPGGE